MNEEINEASSLISLAVSGYVSSYAMCQSLVGLKEMTSEEALVQVKQNELEMRNRILMALERLFSA